MAFLRGRGAVRRAICALLASAALLGAAGAASAEGGLQGILASIFGVAPQPEPLPARRRAPAVSRARRSTAPPPLVIRLHPTKPRTVLAEVPAKAKPVSIFEDRTLRRGDAVMMRQGVRVFAGSASWPYRPADFVAVGAGRLDRDTSRLLAQLDRAPRD